MKTMFDLGSNYNAPRTVRCLILLNLVSEYKATANVAMFQNASAANGGSTM